MDQILLEVRQRNHREFGQFSEIYTQYNKILQRERRYGSQLETLRAKVVLLKSKGGGGAILTTSSEADRREIEALRTSLSQIRESMKSIKSKLQKKTGECDTLRDELEKVKSLLIKGENNVRELTLANEGLVEQMIQSKSNMAMEMNKITSICDQKSRQIARLEKEIRDLKASGATVDKKRRSSSSTGGSFWSTLTGGGRNSSKSIDKEADEMVGQVSGWRRGGGVCCPSSSMHFFQAHKSDINDLSFCKSEGREICVTASSDNTVKMWDSRSGQGVGTLRASAPVMSVAARNGIVVGGTTDSQALVWVTRTQRTRHKMTGHRGKIMSVEFSSDSRYVVTAATDRTVKVWDINRNKCEGTLHCPSECTSAVFTMDGSTIVTSHKDSGLRFWDFRTRAMQQEIKNIHRACITCIQISPSGSGAPRLLTSSMDNSMNVVDGRTFMPIATFRDLKFRTGSVNSKVCFSPKAGYIAAGGSTGSVFVWDTSDPEKGSQQLDGHSACVTACAWGSRTLGTGDRRGYLALWV